MPSQLSPGESAPLLVPSLSAEDVANTSEESEKARQTRLSYRIAAAMFSFAVLGLFQSSIGVMLQPLSKQYSLTDVHVSLIFLVGPAGYLIAAYCNGYVHSRFGQRGVAVLGPLLHAVSAVLIAIHPPFTLILLAFGITGVGVGFLDGPWCAWAGAMEKANAISGLLHGSYSSGAAIGPFLAGAMMSSAHRPWFEWYYVLVGQSHCWVRVNNANILD
jgi:fucose permease